MFLLGSLSKDGNGSETVEKAIPLDWQNNNSARASRFLEHFFVLTTRFRRESNFTFCKDGKHQTTTFYFLFLTFDIEFNSRKKRQHLKN